MAQQIPRGAVVILLTPHSRNVSTGQVLAREPLEERRLGGASDEEEGVVGRRIQVRRPPLLDVEAVASAAEDDGVAGRHVRVVER